MNSRGLIGSFEALAHRWDAVTRASARPHERAVLDALGSVLRPGAGEARVEALDERVQARLPLSRRRPACNDSPQAGDPPDSGSPEVPLWPPC